MSKSSAVILLVLATASAIFGQPQSNSSERVSDACAEVDLPSSVTEILKTQLERWRPERFSDLYGDDQKLWSGSHAKECPGIAIGHFESKVSITYAVLLVPRSEALHGFQLVVFSRDSSGDTYTARAIERATKESDFAPVIYKMPPGHYIGFDESKSIRTKLDGIGVEWIEKSSFIDYWYGGRYHKIWTSD